MARPVRPKTAYKAVPQTLGHSYNQWKVVVSIHMPRRARTAFETGPVPNWLTFLLPFRLQMLLAWAIRTTDDQLLI
jgi:hypothetical protein